MCKIPWKVSDVLLLALSHRHKTMARQWANARKKGKTERERKRERESTEKRRKTKTRTRDGENKTTKKKVWVCVWRALGLCIVFKSLRLCMCRLSCCWACWRVVTIRAVLLQFVVLPHVLFETHMVNNEDGTTKWFDDVGDDVLVLKPFRYGGEFSKHSTHVEGFQSARPLSFNVSFVFAISCLFVIRLSMCVCFGEILFRSVCSLVLLFGGGGCSLHVRDVFVHVGRLVQKRVFDVGHVCVDVFCVLLCVSVVVWYVCFAFD